MSNGADNDISPESQTSEAAAKDAHAVITLVAPNGAEDPEAYHPHQTVGHVLDEAVREFGRQGYLDPKSQYVLVLGETPLENGLTLEQAGVQPGAKLKVRSKSIPGDGSCIPS